MVHRGDIAERIVYLTHRQLELNGYMALGVLPKTQENKMRAWLVNAELNLLWFFMYQLKLVVLFPDNPNLTDEDRERCEQIRQEFLRYLTRFNKEPRRKYDIG